MKGQKRMENITKKRTDQLTNTIPIIAVMFVDRPNVTNYVINILRFSMCRIWALRRIHVVAITLQILKA